MNNNGDIDLSDQNLTELTCVFPGRWGKGFYCEYNKLTSLEGASKEVGGDFYCRNNPTKFTEKQVRDIYVM